MNKTRRRKQRARNKQRRRNLAVVGFDGCYMLFPPIMFDWRGPDGLGALTTHMITSRKTS